MAICTIAYKKTIVWQETKIAEVEENSMNKTEAKAAMEELTGMFIYLLHYMEQDRFTNKDDKYV